MVGNGVTDYKYDDMQPTVEMGFWYGILNTTTYNAVVKYCTLNKTGTDCQNWLDEGMNVIESSGINIYDAFGKCYNSSSFTSEPTLQQSKISSLLRTGLDTKMTSAKRYFTSADYTPFLNRKSSSKKLIPPCVYAKPVLDYLNNATVRLSLNIPVSV